MRNIIFFFYLREISRRNGLYICTHLLSCIDDKLTVTKQTLACMLRSVLTTIFPHKNLQIYNFQIIIACLTVTDCMQNGHHFSSSLHNTQNQMFKKPRRLNVGFAISSVLSIRATSIGTSGLYRIVGSYANQSADIADPVEPIERSSSLSGNFNQFA